ncbi:putative dipeptidyl-aminopeptidase B [Microthyrium microscopicum]|uniref:dipeptidyl-peptidase IV n=1 Tax=Microthyrium microscopicum TaxID=703497 RepID=A0A6A6UTV7_9PEZI|nr:putative dipeptidyl-aminopeptidase B [Microthyrium microscopicum]
MAPEPDYEETKPLTADSTRTSLDTDSTSSIVLENLNGFAARHSANEPYSDKPLHGHPLDDDDDVEAHPGTHFNGIVPIDRKARRVIWLIALLCLVGWGLAAAQFVISGGYKHASTRPHDPAATQTVGSGRKVTLDQVLTGAWRARKHAIRWIAGPEGQDGLLLEAGGGRGGYLVVDDVRNREGQAQVMGDAKRILMLSPHFTVGSASVYPAETWPSPNLRTVLVMSGKQGNWRHSFTGLYWLFDVNSQKGEALDPNNPDKRIQLASWSPKGDAIVFVRDNNLFIRKLDDAKSVVQITKDGGKELFYGVPDWVYEEEVFSANSATWWSEDGKYVAFLRTNESMVPTFPVQYFLSRPSGKSPQPGEENYPEVRDIKYPKAGAPNPIVNLLFYDVTKNNVFEVKIDGDFEDKNRLINEVVWAGTDGKVLVKETNRVSDVLKVVLIDAERRTGRTVREQDVNKLDGGWFEVSEKTRFIPPDPKNGRPHSGYVDTIIHEGYDHLAYFTPLDSSDPIMLTSGKWEVVDAPSSIDLKNNWVYFVATKESAIQRHVYRVKLDGSSLSPVTDSKVEGYHDVSFSSGSGFALLDYEGPGVPWQKVISTPDSPKYEQTIEDNTLLKGFASAHELPINVYSTINIDGYELNVLERRPPHFSEKRKYPVLFYMYQGPGSQTVAKKFTVDFQAYVAASLGYIVVTVDGRGTGFMGRKTRCIVRGNLGQYEAADQIAAAKIWKAKKYVDGDRMAIWGWSYGGFMTLKTLEVDQGQTFKYGMAVAPVTDWRFYDSIYTERYMLTPQENAAGYDNTSIHDVNGLGKNVRFLVMHGVADDNVHTQNTYTLIDKLDLAGVENYDVHVFPDSDHGIYFHNANRIVYDKLQNWLINAFNGEWLRTEDPKPKVVSDVIVRKA